MDSLSAQQKIVVGKPGIKYI